MRGLLIFYFLTLIPSAIMVCKYSVKAIKEREDVDPHPALIILTILGAIVMAIIFTMDSSSDSSHRYYVNGILVAQGSPGPVLRFFLGFFIGGIAPGLAALFIGMLWVLFNPVLNLVIPVIGPAIELVFARVVSIIEPVFARVVSIIRPVFVRVKHISKKRRRILVIIMLMTVLPPALYFYVYENAYSR